MLIVCLFYYLWYFGCVLSLISKTFRIWICREMQVLESIGRPAQGCRQSTTHDFYQGFCQGKSPGQGFRELHFSLSSYLASCPWVSDFLYFHFIFLICEQTLMMLGLRTSACTNSQKTQHKIEVVTGSVLLLFCCNTKSQLGSFNSSVCFHCSIGQNSEIKVIFY